MNMYICCIFFSTKSNALNLLNVIKIAFALVLNLSVLMYLEFSPHFNVLFVYIQSVPGRGFYFKGKNVYIFMNDHRNFDSSS